MRSISISLFYLILILLALGCFGSRGRRDEADSDFGGAGGGGTVRSTDAGIFDVNITRDSSEGLGGIENSDSTGSMSDIYEENSDDAKMDKALCEPNCPALQWVTIKGGTFKMGSVEGKALKDHIHICLAMPPKYSVAGVIGLLKGKSASEVMSFGTRRSRMIRGRRFWATSRWSKRC